MNREERKVVETQQKNEKNLKMEGKDVKTFNFRGYENHCLLVGHYNSNKAMGISVVDLETEEEIGCLTVLIPDFDYDIGLVTVCADIVDGDEIFGYKTGTDILKDLGIVEKVWETIEYDDGTGDIEKADVCTIDLYKLKEYSKDWNYYEFEPED